MKLSAYQYKQLFNLQYDMARVGWHPAIAGKLILGALDRLERRRDAGMGKVHQTRRIRREDPGVPPRPVVAGERCQRIQEVPGQETALYPRINELQRQGWNVMEVPRQAGFPKLKVYYACPPGVVPREAQSQILQSQPYGAPLYVGEF